MIYVGGKLLRVESIDAVIAGLTGCTVILRSGQQVSFADVSFKQMQRAIEDAEVTL